MTNVVVVVGVVAQTFPAGTTQGNILVSLTPDTGNTNPAQTPQTLPDAGTVTFANVPPGAWVASAVREDAGGNPIGTAITSKVDVPAPTVSINVPQTITVTLA
jgi:hypothetical protein